MHGHIFTVKECIGFPDFSYLPYGTGNPFGTVFDIIGSVFHKQRPGGDQRADIADVSQVPEPGGIIAGTEMTGKERVKIAVNIAADDGKLNSLIHGGKPHAVLSSA